MSEKGDELFEEVKSLIKQKMEPFHQDIIGITETFNYLKKDLGKEITRQNELAEVLTKLDGERLGECKHILSGKTPVLWCIRNQKKYKKQNNKVLTNTDKASDYWVPLKFKEWDMKEENVNRVKSNIKELLADPEWLKQAELEWAEKAKKAEKETEEVPF